MVPVCRGTGLRRRGQENTRQSLWTKLKTLVCTASSKWVCVSPPHPPSPSLSPLLLFLIPNCYSSHRYYAMEVSYFKSLLDSHLLDLLWNKYWVNTLSTCSLLTVSICPSSLPPSLPILYPPSPFTLLLSCNRMLTIQHKGSQIYLRNWKEPSTR